MEHKDRFTIILTPLSFRIKEVKLINLCALVFKFLEHIFFKKKLAQPVIICRVSLELPEYQITAELHLSGSWLSGSPIIQIGLALRVGLVRIIQNQLALKLLVIGSSGVRVIASRTSN
jgi:hypothetical protein